MAKYLRTSGITAQVEDLIRNARERLYVISPYLKLSDPIKELLNDKNKEKVEVRIIFGKQELSPTEMSFLQSLKYIRLFFSKNLHAKCYLNEDRMVICSMNLYEFSQQNNREMGILIERSNENDKPVYEEAWLDIQSILNNADDFSYIEAPKKIEKSDEKPHKAEQSSGSSLKFYSVTSLSKELGISSKELTAKFEFLKWIYRKGDEWQLTSLGKSKGAVIKSGQYGDYIAYPESVIEEILQYQY